MKTNKDGHTTIENRGPMYQDMRRIKIFQVPNLRGIYAPLDSLVLYGNIHPYSLS